MQVAERGRDLDKLFEASPLAIFALNADLTVRMWNPAAEREFGWADHEVCGRPLPILPGNLAEQLFMTGNLEGGKRHTKIQVCRKDGRFAIAEIATAPLLNGDLEIDGVMAIVVALTDRTRVADEVLVHEHDLLSVLMESIPDTIYFKDTASRFVRINKAQANSLGVENPEDAVGKTDFDFFASDHSQDAFEDEQRIVNTLEPVISKRERIRMADGQFRWVTATKVPMVNRHGGVTGIAGISEISLTWSRPRNN